MLLFRTNSMFNNEKPQLNDKIKSTNQFKKTDVQRKVKNLE